MKEDKALDNVIQTFVDSRKRLRELHYRLIQSGHLALAEILKRELDILQKAIKELQKSKNV